MTTGRFRVAVGGSGAEQLTRVSGDDADASDHEIPLGHHFLNRHLQIRKRADKDAEHVLRRVYQATGAIDAYRRVNRRAVRDRTEAAMVMLTEFGLELPLPDGGTARIDDQRIEVIAEGEAPMEFR